MNKMTEMNIRTFAETIAKEIGKALPETTVEVAEVAKNNVTLTGIRIGEDGSNIAPCIYLEDDFKALQRGEKDCPAIVNGLLKAYEKAKVNKCFEMPDLTDFESVKNKIFPRVVSAENADFLKDKPHYKYGDLAVLFAVNVEINDFGMGNVNITDNLLEGLDVGLSDLLNASRDRIHEVRFRGMNEVIAEMKGIPSEELAEFPERMWVATNKQKMLGAIALLNTKMLDQLSENLGCGLYILPSSIHEILALRDTDGEVSELHKMVREVNDTTVSPEERLSYNVYHYTEGKLYVVYEDGRTEECVLTEAN